MTSNPYQAPVEQSGSSKRVSVRFGRTHLLTLLIIWAGFTALTYQITAAGIDRGAEHDRQVAVTTCCAFLGPMTGAISRNWQSCCLANSLGLLPYCGASLAMAIVPQFLRLSICGAGYIRMSLWIFGWFGWFAGGPVSFLHALN